MAGSAGGQSRRIEDFDENLRFSGTAPAFALSNSRIPGLRPELAVIRARLSMILRNDDPLAREVIQAIK